MQTRTTSPLCLRSYFLGGFESATHVRRDRCRVDATASSYHDAQCEEDYSLLRSAGVRSVRDALRWHRIETSPGNYDWSTLLAMLDAARLTQTQVLWDLCHWGTPDWLSPFDESFPDHFCRFAQQAVVVLRDFHQRHCIPEPPVVCPINEISFWAWVGGDVEHFFPFGLGRGPELKRQLARASNAAIAAMRRICPEVRILQPEPLIHIAVDALNPFGPVETSELSAAQYEAWDMLLGVRCPELGGSATNIDVLGVNYYWNNQWIHDGPRTPPGHPQHRSLHRMLHEIWLRYRKPLILSETSAEGDAGAGWFSYVMAEVRQAEQLGVPVLGVCLFPVMDYAGWDDDRHCSIGLIELAPGMRNRTLRGPMLAELRLQQAILAKIQTPVLV